MKPAEPEKSLSWTEFDISGSGYCDDDIWEDINFAAESSEDEVSSVFSVDSSPRDQHSSVPDEEYVIPDALFSSGEDENLIKSINSVQFWKPENNLDRARQERNSRVVTELQMLRETIFMLQGLPTSLFWRLDETVEVDSRYTLLHSSNEALSSVLRSFSQIGSKIDVLRRFTQTPRSIPYMQTFHRRIEDCLRDFDMNMSDTQSKYLPQKSIVSISLLQLLDEVRRSSRLLLLLSDLVSSITESASNEPVRYMDMLYDLVCMTQATCDDADFRFLAEFFLSCFETYARPIRLWVERGYLDSGDWSFFVRENRKDGNLRTLWHDSYVMDEAALVNAPKFLRPVAQKIFTTGKSMVFLQHLNLLPDNLNDIKKASLTFNDIFPQESPSSLCLPFSALLETAFGRLVDANLAVTSTLLRKELDEQCGLWISLQALEHIYLCKDMSILSPIDTKIFDLIDRGRSWNDRFLLTELAQSAFSIVPFVDPSGLIVRSKAPSTQPGTHARSVKHLQALSIDYVLPWPVSNIITKDSITTYQRISTFLLQIRRAKHAISKHRLQYSASAQGPRTNAALGYAIRHNMLWFLNTLYSHITDLVISTTTESMRKSLSSSQDVDSMISVYKEYMDSMESQCLLSHNLSPLYNAVINLLDICVHFADLQSSHQTLPHSPNTPSRKESANYTSALEALDNSDSDTDSEADTTAIHARTSLDFNSTAYTERLKTLKKEFSSLVGFIAAGLKEVGRVNGQRSWEILAEKLEWRDARVRGVV